MIDKFDPKFLETWEPEEKEGMSVSKPVETDEDFINYLNFYSMALYKAIELEKNPKKLMYLKGKMDAIKSISQVYCDLISGKFI